MNVRRFIVLDGMRGLAALAVGLLHSEQLTHSNIPPQTSHLAVDFFFCLSGFVLAASYAERIRAGQLGFADYLIKRLIRLYPLILAGVAVGSLSHLHWLKAPDLLAASIAFAFMLPIGLLSHQQPYYMNNPLWSILFELIASVVFFPIASRSRLAIAGALVSAPLLAAIILTFGTIDGVGFDSPVLFLLGFVRVGFPFCAGILIFAWVNNRPGLAIPAVVPLTLLIAMLEFPRSTGAELVFALIAVPAIVAMAAVAQHSRLDPVFNLLGLASYPFYAVHRPIFVILERLGLAAAPLSIPVQLAVALAIAILLLLVYDQPARKWLSRRVARNARAPGVPVGEST